MRRRFLVWFYVRVELLLTHAFRLFRNLAFQAAGEKKFYPAPNLSPKSMPFEIGDPGIIITTFEQRFFIYAIPLIASLRKTLSNPIYLMVNGNYHNPASTDSIRELLRRLSEFDDVYPVFFGKMHGCASMWNTGLRHSNRRNNLVLNDDITIREETIGTELSIATKILEKNPLVTINNSWSHFLISDRSIEKFGYFDERFLGFGEEDGDYIRRIVEGSDSPPANVQLSGFVNIIDQSRDSSVATSWGKYSLFNKCVFYLKYPGTPGSRDFLGETNSGAFPKKCDLDSVRKFRDDLYPMLLSTDPQEVTRSILKFYS